MKYKYPIFSVFLLWALLSYAQSFEIPSSFKHLKQVSNFDYIDGYVFTHSEVDTNVRSIKLDHYSNEYSDVCFPICFIKINKKDEDKTLVVFEPGPSMDPEFVFYKKEENKFKYLFRLGGQELYIPGNGNLYIVGLYNNMYTKKWKYTVENDLVYEVKQPYYEVGLKTICVQSIQLFSDQQFTEVLATLPAKSEIEIIAANSTDDHYLIKSSFGLLGWWKYEFDYGSLKRSAIPALYYHGD